MTMSKIRWSKMNKPSPKRLGVTFLGHVQGVGFRVNAIQQAGGLDITGFVRNQPDGSVYLDAQGPSTDVDQLLQRIKRSMASQIDEVNIDERPPMPDRQGFVIRDW